MQNYRDVVIDPTGMPVGDATIEVFIRPAGGPHINRAALFDEAGVPIANPLMTSSYGEFEFYAANGKYVMKITKEGFNGNHPKQINFILGDPDSIDYIQALEGSLLLNGLIEMDHMPFRIFFVDNPSAMLALQSPRRDDIAIRRSDWRKYVHDGTSWRLIDLVATVNGQSADSAGNVVVGYANVPDFVDGVMLGANLAGGVLQLDQNGLIPDRLLPVGGSILRLVDDSTGTMFRLAVSNGELVIKPSMA